MRAKTLFFCTGAVVSLLTLNLSAQSGDAALVVHEWGTFTSLQDEAGAAIGGVNTDDEPVPPFVHRLSSMLLLNRSEMPAVYFKGLPTARCDLDITMRLETPVIYFHPAATAPADSMLNVQVKFNGGWLSEYYPYARLAGEGITTNGFRLGPLRSDTVTTLTWDGLHVGGDWSGPATEDHVWTSPRAVRAAPVRTTGGESERFLFYRGVAHLDAPLRISSKEGELTIRGQANGALTAKGPMPIRSLWLVDIQPDGKLAFKTLPAVTLDGDASRVLTTTSSHFDSSEYGSGSFAGLKQSLHEALVNEGLFDDEAQALLNTWELSYFRSPGLRVFFLVPRAWTDACLPLEISTPAKIERVMIGRIELVTPAQRELLQELSRVSAEKLKQDIAELQKQLYQPGTARDWNKLYSGQTSLSDAKIAIPKSYQTYLALGRFRNTLVLDEQARRPSENLAAFIAAFRLAGFQPAPAPLNSASK